MLKLAVEIASKIKDSDQTGSRCRESLVARPAWGTRRVFAQRKGRFRQTPSIGPIPPWQWPGHRRRRAKPKRRF